MRYLVNFFAFLDGLEVGMTVGVTEVFLLDHFRPHSLVLLYLFHSLALNIVLALYFRSYLSLDRCISIHCSRDVIFHSIDPRHSFESIPRVPLGLTHELEHCWFWCVAVSYCCLFVQSVNLQFYIIGDGLFAR